MFPSYCVRILFGDKLINVDIFCSGPSSAEVTRKLPSFCGFSFKSLLVKLRKFLY